MIHILSRHVRIEMMRRGIPRTVIESVISNPQQKVPELPGVMCYQSLMDINQRTYLVRVMVNENTVPAKVVTAYRTSKIAKYWRATP